MVRSRARARFFVACVAVTCVTGCGIVLGLESLVYEPTLDGSVDGAADDARVERSDGGPDSPSPSVDAEAPFDLAARWTSYKPPGTSGPGYQAGPYDGRFTYFLLIVPAGTASAIVRYDTDAPFDAPESWSTFPVVGIADVSAHRALAFDGRYLWLPGVRTLDGGTLTGVSPNTIAARYRYGLLKLRAKLKGQNHEDWERLGNLDGPVDTTATLGPVDTRHLRVAAF